jgi:chromosomal replication initiator protein
MKKTNILQPDTSGGKSLKLACEIANISIEEARSSARTKEVCHRRNHAMWVMRQWDGWSYPNIGRMLKRDHTTIIHGVKTHQERLNQQANKSGLEQ